MVMLGAGGVLVEQEMTDDGHLKLSRVDQSGTRHPIAFFDATDYPVGITPTQITPDGTGLWMGSTRGRDLTHPVRVDLDSGEETLVDSHPTLELDAVHRAVAQTSPPLICDCATGALLGVRYLGERQEIRALDPGFAEILGALEQLSDGDIGELTSDRSGLRWTVSFVHDRDPSVTYLYDHATGASRRLFRPFPHLDPNAMAPMTPVTITARDGRPLPSYLTLPLGQEPTALPLVLLVHGGPWYRDSWGVRPWRPDARQPRVCSPAGQFPRLHRVREGPHQRRRGRIRGRDARRPGRRGRLGSSAGVPHMKTDQVSVL